jgi:hypothetical protein
LFKRLVLVLLVILSINLYAKTILFDLTKDELAGNADWTIGENPTWIGAYSEFGKALRNEGYTTKTLYGSTITSSDLSSVSVFVIPEPQNKFTSSEISAVVDFVNNGGGVFLIADHKSSDRNNNGYDSPMIYNLWTPQYFDIEFDNKSNSSSTATNFSQHPITYIETPRTAITEGISSIGEWAACTITPYSKAQAHIWIDSSHQKEAVVSSTYGNGRIVAIGDSSPFDDGKGNSGNDLYDGWDEYDDAKLAVNIIKWLAKDSNGMKDNQNALPANMEISLFPNPTSGRLSIRANGYEDKMISMSLFDVSGRLITTFRECLPTNVDLRKGCKSSLKDGVYILKINIDKKTKVFTFLLYKDLN